MTKKEFRELAEKGFLFLDGATGSNLVKKGMPAGVCPEKWILENPHAIIELQNEYVEAGSNIVYAPTFTSNRIKLAEYGLENDIVKINTELVRLSKEAVNGRALVAGDLTMTGKQLSPMGDMEFETLIDVYKEQIGILNDAGVDLLIVETMMSLQETRAALIAAKETCDLPVMCTLSFEEDGRTLYGSSADNCAIVLESLGADAVGANCSTGPDKLSIVIEKMASICSIPIIAKPNAGMPVLDKNGDTIYTMDEETFAEESMLLIDAGATILGGCCGTAPSYIEALKKKTESITFKKRQRDESIRYLSSERKTLGFTLNDPFIVVGERINPTGKKKLQEELRNDSLEMVLRFTEEQESAGAKILDVNVGMGGIDEKAMMLKVLDAVTMESSLPISVDTSSPEVLEAALRRYCGRALVNSVSCESAVMEKKLQTAAKYGAMIIVLPLNDEGLPKSLDEKIKNIETVTKRAYELGFKETDIVIDGLVSTVGANKRSALEVIETVRYAKSHNLASTCGLSNISFGLPERSFINTAFLTVLISNGLTMAIMNPSQDLLMNAYFATDLLMDKKDADLAYIERMNNSSFTIQKGSASTESKPADEKRSEGSDNILYRDVLKGNLEKIKEHTEEELKKGEEADDLLNTYLLPAIGEVGNLFNSGKYFLPQLISSAETMKASIEVLKPHMSKNDGDGESAVVVMATVKGDIHDIGKNLVVLMLENYGFKVIDLGKDVEKELIVKTAMENNAAIIGLSALMTTTMEEMRRVVEYAHECGCTSKIMVGGAVITEDYAKEIGADAYSKDAQDAVEVAKSLISG
ncbi:MAG: homocysteine S-methyltransferase family protein [Lachnospiraceae bacterium]|nr:homocysteine S-methyltransferase family protein [Lachnospiraceae bacterium]